jgi:hypothetical protein
MYVNDARNFFSELALQVLGRAQSIAFSERPYYFIGDSEPRGEWIEECDLERDIIGSIRQAIAELTRDAGAMEEMAKNIDVSFEAQEKHIDEVRRLAEHPDMQDRLLQCLNQFVASVLKLTNVRVELLSSRDALAYGCRGFYKPEKDGEPAKVSIAMSNYGTLELLSFDEIAEAFADAMAYHVIASTEIRKALPTDEGLSEYYQPEELDRVYVRVNPENESWSVAFKADSDEKALDNLRNEMATDDRKIRPSHHDYVKREILQKISISETLKVFLTVTLPAA